jgi:hypothetical protein
MESNGTAMARTTEVPSLHRAAETFEPSFPTNDLGPASQAVEGVAPEVGAGALGAADDDADDTSDGDDEEDEDEDDEDDEAASDSSSIGPGDACEAGGGSP